MSNFSHEEYDRLAALESKQWEDIHYDGQNIYKDKKVLLQWANHPIVTTYNNIFQTGNPSTDWLDFLVEHFRHFNHGCSIGCGSGWMEEKLVEHNFVEIMDCFDISEGAIEGAIKKNRYPKRLNFVVQDCNKIKLEHCKYDFIVFHHSLHHLLELEYIIESSAEALSPQGIVVIVDYIGETRGQWEADKLYVCRLLLNWMPSTIRKNVASFDENFFRDNPFEMIRSAEILPILESKLRPIWQTYIGGILYPMNDTVVACIPERIFDKFILLTCYFDALYNEIIKPCFTFSVFTSNQNRITIDANPVKTDDILACLSQIKLNDPEKIVSSEKNATISGSVDESIYFKALRYFNEHGLVKTLGRSFEEIGKRLKS